MPNYKILLEGVHVFSELIRHEGHTLEAAQGDVVRLIDEGKSEAHDLALKFHLEAEHLVATDEAVTEKAVAPVVQKSEEELAAEKAAVEKALAEQTAPPADVPPVLAGSADVPADGTPSETLTASNDPAQVDPTLPATQ